MHFRDPYFADNIPRLHRAYRSARGSGQPVALLVTAWDDEYDENEIFRDTIRYFTERGEDISDHVYCPQPGCCDLYARVLRDERTCVVVDAMIRVGYTKISRFSIRNLETTRDLVHDVITCIPMKDRWALPEIEHLLDRTGFRVVLFRFRAIRVMMTWTGTGVLSVIQLASEPGRGDAGHLLHALRFDGTVRG